MKSMTATSPTYFPALIPLIKLRKQSLSKRDMGDEDIEIESLGQMIKILLDDVVSGVVRFSKDLPTSDVGFESFFQCSKQL